MGGLNLIARQPGAAAGAVPIRRLSPSAGPLMASAGVGGVSVTGVPPGQLAGNGQRSVAQRPTQHPVDASEGLNPAYVAKAELSRPIGSQAAASAATEASRILHRQLGLQGGMVPTSMRVRGRRGGVEREAEGGKEKGREEGEQELKSVTDQLAELSKKQLLDLVGRMQVRQSGCFLVMSSIESSSWSIFYIIG